MIQKLQIIRGPRIIKQLDEATMFDLERNTKNFSPSSSKRQYAVNPIRITSVQLIPATKSGHLEVRAVANSDNKQYDTVILFSDVHFEDEDSPQNITFIGVDQNEYHVVPINLQQSTVKVRCGCLDFRWRFSVQNQSNAALYGDGPGIYQKKTDRPPNNPNNVPGVCKHLLALTNELRQTGLVR